MKKYRLKPKYAKGIATLWVVGWIVQKRVWFFFWKQDNFFVEKSKAERYIKAMEK